LTSNHADTWHLLAQVRCVDASGGVETSLDDVDFSAFQRAQLRENLSSGLAKVI
jgi:hypothetical protein